MALVSDFEPFAVDTASLAFAYDVANMKLPHISTASPGGQARSATKIATNIFHGSLAQSAVVSTLQKYGGTNVEQYDAIRTDAFVNPDLWDLRLHKQIVQSNSPVLSSTVIGGHTYVEVRSSYLERKCLGAKNEQEALDCIRNTYNLLGSYSTSVKPGEMRKDLYFQVYWLYTQPEAEQHFGSLQQRHYLTSCPSSLQKCVVVGFATPDLLATSGKSTNLGQSGASYRLLPISLAIPCSDLPKNI